MLARRSSSVNECARPWRTRRLKIARQAEFVKLALEEAFSYAALGIWAGSRL